MGTLIPRRFPQRSELSLAVEKYMQADVLSGTQLSSTIRSSSVVVTARDRSISRRNVALSDPPSARPTLSSVGWKARSPTSGSTLHSDSHVYLLIPSRDVGLFRPIAALPGCNPSWPKGVTEKPGCAEAPPVPEMVYPNVYFENLWVSFFRLSEVSIVKLKMYSNEPTFRPSSPRQTLRTLLR